MSWRKLARSSIASLGFKVTRVGNETMDEFCEEKNACSLDISHNKQGFDPEALKGDTGIFEIAPCGSPSDRGSV